MSLCAVDALPVLLLCYIGRLFGEVCRPFRPTDLDWAAHDNGVLCDLFVIDTHAAHCQMEDETTFIKHQARKQRTRSSFYFSFGAVAQGGGGPARSFAPGGEPTEAGLFRRSGASPHLHGGRPSSQGAQENARRRRRLPQVRHAAAVTSI